MIPRIIHQIWLGGRPLPDSFATYVASWRRHHPGWEHRLWTETSIPTDLRRPEPLERIRHPAERADILRLEILWRLGGVYVDTDFECRRSLEPYIGDAEFFTAYLKPKEMTKRSQRRRVNNAFVGSVPGHPLLDRALDELEPQEWHGHFDKRASGSLFFDALVHEFPDVLILPAELIYPITPGQEEQAVAIHEASRSWCDAEGFRRATLKAEKRLRHVGEQVRAEQRAHAKTKRRLRRTEALLAKPAKRRGWQSRLSRLLAR